MKRILSFGILTISLVIFFVVIHLNHDQYNFSELLLPENTIAQIKTNAKPTDQDLLQSVTFNEYPLFYDKSGSRWFYSVNPENPELNPSVGYISNDNSVQLAFSEKIIPGQQITMIAHTASEYREYQLVITTLPLIQIESNDVDFPPRVYTRDRYDISFTLFDNRPDVLQHLVVSDGSIHIRGWSSRHYDKNGFRLQLTEKGISKNAPHENQTSLLGMRPDGDWLLYAAYNDQEKIRNVFSSNLWMNSCGADNSFGIQNGMEYRFVELFFNQQYWGLYALGYPIDAKQMQIKADNQGHYDEFLFKQKEWSPKTEVIDPDQSGITLQFPAIRSDELLGYELLQMHFSQLYAGSPSGFWYNDLNNALDIWLFMKLIQAVDSVGLERNMDSIGYSGIKMKNMMFTIKYTEEARKLLYTPWDMDISWGNGLKTSAKNNTLAYAYSPDNNSLEMMLNPTAVLLRQDESIKKLIRNQYHTLRSHGWSDAVIDEILDGFEQDIYGSGAYVRDMERWPNGSYQDPEIGLSLFREYVHARLDAMDQYIESF